MNEAIYRQTKNNTERRFVLALREWDRNRIIEYCWARDLPKEQCLAYLHLANKHDETYETVSDQYKVEDFVFRVECESC